MRGGIVSEPGEPGAGPAPSIAPAPARREQTRLVDLLDFVWKPAALFLLNAALALVCFPFFAPVSIVALISAAFSIVLGVQGLRHRRLAFLAWSLVTAVAALVWATLGIYVLQPGRLYCYIDGPFDPFSGAIIDVGRDSSRLFIVGDPLRRSAAVKWFVERLRSDVVFLESRRFGSDNVMLIPLSAAVRHPIQGTSGVTSSVQFVLSYYGPSISIGFEEEELEITTAVIYLPLVDVVERASEQPWRGVIHSREQAVEVAQYVAYLDVALSCASRGDFEHAIEGFDRGYKLAPTSREQARTLSLLSLTTFAVTGGNLGKLQSFSYYNAAIKRWSVSWKGQPVVNAALTDPVDLWLYGIFRSEYYERQREKWAHFLNLEDPTVTISARFQTGKEIRTAWRKFGTDPPEQSAIDAEAQQLLALIGGDGETGALARAVRERYGWSATTKRWLFEMLKEAQGPPVTPHDKVRLATKWAIAQLDEPWRAQYEKYDRVEDLIAQWLQPSPGERTGEEVAAYFTRISEIIEFQRLGTTFRAFGSAALKKAASETLKLPNPGDAPKVAWWERSFQDWFAAKVASIWLDYAENCHNKSSNCAATLRRWSDELVTDRTAEPHRFVPGIGFMIGLTRLARLDVPDDWVSLYRESLGMDPP
jgi:hypothetical protein